MREEDGCGPRRRTLSVLSVVAVVLLMPALVLVSGMRGVWPWWSFLGPVGVVVAYVALARILVGAGWHRLLRPPRSGRSTMTWHEVRQQVPVGLGVAIALVFSGIGRGNVAVLLLGGLLAAVPAVLNAGVHRREWWSRVAAGRNEDRDRPGGG
ncbi:MAG TPA: hypothetical protein VEZ42_01470 [Pseudonocardia sp.]|nr:hypothetical protein [Pseudonocardia sp.]